MDTEKHKVPPTMLHDGRMMIPPQGYPLLMPTSIAPKGDSGRAPYRTGADRPEKMKFKIHHVNDKDFQQDKVVEKRRKRAVKQFESAATPHKVIESDATPSNKESIVGGVAPPQTYATTNITQPSDAEEDDAIITVDNPSSEGTVSISPSPPVSPIKDQSNKDDINITVAHEEPVITKIGDMPLSVASTAPAVPKTSTTIASADKADPSTISYGNSQDNGKVLRHDVFMSPYIKDNSSRELAITSSSRPPSPPPSPSLPQTIKTSQPFEMDEDDDFVMVSTVTVGQSSLGFINTFVPVSSNSSSPATPSNKPPPAPSGLATGYIPHSSPLVVTATSGDIPTVTMDETGSIEGSTDSEKSLELDIDIEEEENENESPGFQQPTPSPPVHSEDVVDITLSEYQEFSTNISHSNSTQTSAAPPMSWSGAHSPPSWQNTDSIDIAATSALLSPPSENESKLTSPVTSNATDTQHKIPLSSKVDDLVVQESVDRFEKHRKESDLPFHNKIYKQKSKESRLGTKVAKHLAASKSHRKSPSSSRDGFYDKQPHHKNDKYSVVPRDIPHSDEISKQKRREDNRLGVQQQAPPRVSLSPSNPRYKHGYAGNESTTPTLSSTP